MPSTLPAAPQQLLLLYKDYIVYSLNISSPSDWTINKKLSDITLDFLSKSLSFHMDVINSTTIAVADDQMNIYIYNLYNQQLTLTFNLRELFPDYPLISNQIPNNLCANEEYFYVTSSTNTEPNDKQYLFRIYLNGTGENVDLIMFSDENFGLTELISWKDTVYSFERLYEAEDYFNIYKMGTPTKK